MDKNQGDYLKRTQTFRLKPAKFCPLVLDELLVRLELVFILAERLAVVLLARQQLEQPAPVAVACKPVRRNDAARLY